VAQNFPLTAQDIFDVLNNDVDFTSLLGTYTFKAGQPLAALSIISPGADLPSVRKVEGLECVIQDAGNFTSYPYLSGEASRTRIEWSVFLVCWEPSTGADMQAAAERACSRFLGSQAVQTVAVADGIGAQSQTKVMVYSDMPIIPA